MHYIRKRQTGYLSKNRNEILAFWQVVQNHAKDNKPSSIKKEVLAEGRYYGLTDENGPESAHGLAPSKVQNWCRSVIVGTMYEKNKHEELKKSPGITKDMDYWHSLADWETYTNSKHTQVYFVGGTHWFEVTKYKQHATTIFYSIGDKMGKR